MLIECDLFAGSEFPAAHATASALCTVTAAYFPIVAGFLALENNGGGGQVVRVGDLPALAPLAKNQVEIGGQVFAIQKIIDKQNANIKVMKELQCDAQSHNLGVYLFDENGNIEAVKQSVTEGGTTTVSHLPIPIRSLYIGDKIHGGLEAPDSNAISWSFLPNYSDDLAIVAPSDFNPLTDLVPATT